MILYHKAQKPTATEHIAIDHTIQFEFHHFTTFSESNECYSNIKKIRGFGKWKYLFSQNHAFVLRKKFYLEEMFTAKYSYEG